MKGDGSHDLVAVVGHAAVISAGERIEVAGTRTNDRTQALPFRASVLEATSPATAKGIERLISAPACSAVLPRRT